MLPGLGTAIVATTSRVAVSMRTTLDASMSVAHSEVPSDAIENALAGSGIVATTLFVVGSTWAMACPSAAPKPPSAGLITQTEVASIARSEYASRCETASEGISSTGVATGIVATTAFVAGSIRESVPSI
jgi:alkaline phosphatase